MKTISEQDGREVIKSLTEVVHWVVSGTRKATKFISPKLTVKATRQHRFNRKDNRESYVVSIGSPNYAERQFIAAALKAGEPFPIKKIQFKYYPVKKK